MQQYLVVAHFELLEGSSDKFVEEVQRVAAASLRDEPGCKRYDVLMLQGNERRGTLYELYAEKADHEAHKRTPHFNAFWDGIAQLKVRWNVDHGWLHKSNAFNTPQ